MDMEKINCANFLRSDDMNKAKQVLINKLSGLEFNDLFYHAFSSFTSLACWLVAWPNRGFLLSRLKRIDRSDRSEQR
jgi:hypothetical protein